MTGEHAAVPRVSAPTAIGPVGAPPPRRRPGPSLRVDWPRCKAHGLCHELAPELIDLDQWGYPVVDAAVPLTGDVLDATRRAVQSCPTLALRIVGPG